MKVPAQLGNVAAPTELRPAAKLSAMSENNRISTFDLPVGRHRLKIVGANVTDLDKPALDPLWKIQWRCLSKSLLFVRRTLVGENDLSSFTGRLHDGQADLKGCHTPSPVVVHGPILRYRFIQLLQFRIPRGTPPGYWNFLLALIAVDV